MKAEAPLTPAQQALIAALTVYHAPPPPLPPEPDGQKPSS